MNEQQGQAIVDRFRRSAAAGSLIEELEGAAARDFVWIRDAETRPALLGSFRPTDNGGRLFVSVVSVANRTDAFQFFAMERLRSSPMLGTSNCDDQALLWRYRATKQSGDNERRNQEFRRLAGTDLMRIPLPSGDGRDFIERLRWALDLRHRADAAGDDDSIPTVEDTETSSTTGYWKVAPGEKGEDWLRWRDGGYIEIGWSTLGDISQSDEADFNQRLAENRKRHGWRPGGPNQVWKFRNIRVGDRIMRTCSSEVAM